MQKLILIALSVLFMNSACSMHQNAPVSKQIIKKKVKIPHICFQPNAIPLEKRLKERGIQPGAPLYIRIFKREKILELWAKKKKHYILLKSYPICHYSGYLGPKLHAGDKQAPEGIYALTQKSLHPNSHYHLALNINYPNRYDRNHHRDGDLIMIHGKCSSVGCFAMGNRQIEEIYRMVEAALKKGEKVLYVAIYPFRLTPKNLSQFTKSHWYPFWKNLQTSYLFFEETHVPPFAGVKSDRYVFQKRGEELITEKMKPRNDANLTNLTKN
jgi:murein L,D-transpeptidase YafK